VLPGLREPDASLFYVDPNYTEVKPSEFMTALVRADASQRGDNASAASPPVPSGAAKTMQRMDEKYQLSQQYKPLP